MAKLTKREKIKVGVAAVLIALLIGCPVVFAINGGWMGSVLSMLDNLHIAGVGSGRGGASDPVTLAEPIDEQRSFAAADVRAIRLMWHGGEINVVPTDGSEVTIRAELDAGTYALALNNVTYELRDGTLTVDDHLPDDDVDGADYPPARLTVGVPASAWESIGKLELQSVCAAIKVDGATARELNVDTVSSSCDLAGISAQSVAVGTVSGAVNLAGTVSDDLDVETVSGASTLTFGDALPGQVDVSTVSGAVSLQVPDSAGFTLETDTVSGGITAEQDLQVAGEGRYTYGDGAAHISVETVSGSLQLS